MLLKKIIIIFKSQYFSLKMKLYGLVKLPAQTKKERQIFKALFDLLSQNGKLRVFEWGSGYSTLYYAHYLLLKGVDFEWHAIDNNRSWHELVKEFVKKKKLHSRVHLHLMEFKPFWEKPGWGRVPPPCGLFAPSSNHEKNYIDFPRQLGGTFDVVIVDARFRRHCNQTAKDVIHADGVVILHDAQKPHYHKGIDTFPYGRFVDSGTWYPFQDEPNRIWIGSLKNHVIFEWLKTILRD